MSIVVQKYGGSSVANPGKIKAVARRIADTRALGHKVCVVVSAMGDTTDDLIALAKQVTDRPERRELDMLLTAGERISMALLSLALNDLGVIAKSFTGSQSGIITNDAHSNARIVEVRPYRLVDELERGNVVIVAGYQGVSYKKDITTLGRGGSDTTAVALAAALGAEWCEICSDVDGVYSADPRVVPEARRLDQLGYDEMQRLAESGAKVLNAQAVEFARAKGIAIHARSTFAPGPGTIVSAAATATGRVRAIAGESEIALLLLPAATAEELIHLTERCDRFGIASREARLDEGGATLVLSLENAHLLGRAMEELRARFGDRLRLDERFGRVTCVGQGLGADHAILRRGLETLRGGEIAVERTAMTSDALGFVVLRADVAEATRRLHAALTSGPSPAPPSPPSPLPQGEG